MKKMDSSMETNRLMAMVSDSDLKNAPVTPVKKAKGANTTMVLNDDPKIGW